MENVKSPFLIQDNVLVKYTGHSIKVTVPDTVTEIGYEAFAYNDTLETIIVPESVKKLGDAAFSHCKQLKFVTLPKGLEEIGDFAFESCDALDDIAIPTPTKIGFNAFLKSEEFNPFRKKSLYDRAVSFCKPKGEN